MAAKPEGAATWGLEGFDVSESRTRSAGGPGFDSPQVHVNEMNSHEPVLYRPEGESRFTIPAEICVTCSDVEAGILVPASFCPDSTRKMEEQYGSH